MVPAYLVKEESTVGRNNAWKSGWASLTRLGKVIYVVICVAAFGCLLWGFGII
jgi:hypothetical protein